MTPNAPLDNMGERVVVATALYTVEDGKIMIDHDGFPSPEVDDDEELVDDPLTPEADERRTFSVTVAPRLAGDNFVDSADTR